VFKLKAIGGEGKGRSVQWGRWQDYWQASAWARRMSWIWESTFIADCGKITNLEKQVTSSPDFWQWLEKVCSGDFRTLFSSQARLKNIGFRPDMMWSKAFANTDRPAISPFPDCGPLWSFKGQISFRLGQDCWVLFSCQAPLHRGSWGANWKIWEVGNQSLLLQHYLWLGKTCHENNMKKPVYWQSTTPGK